MQTAAVVLFSSILLAGVIVATAVFGLGVKTTYGAGIDPKLGDKVTRDFLADQDAEAAALSKLDQALLDNRLSDNALADVVQEIQSLGDGPAPSVAFQPSSITVLRSQDPSDATLLIEVQEDGIKTVTTDNGANSAPTENQVAFHGDFWLRAAGGHYTIADQRINPLPASSLPQIALVATALVWVGLAYVLYRRARRSPIPTVASPVAPAALEAPVVFEGVEAPEPTTAIAIQSFGGLRVLTDGRDWAPDLAGRQVMGFLWRRLLLAPLEGESADVARDLLARQVYPGVDRETQLERMRKLYNDSLPRLPEPLRRCIQVQPQRVRFQLDGYSFDALELLSIAKESVQTKALSPAQARRARRIVEASQGVFLPDFEQVEDLATDHHPTCTELISRIRQELAEKRSQLLLTLAKTYVAGRRPDLAIAVLEPAVNGSTLGPELRDVLAEAYRDSGRESDARALVQR